jgi:hypothetical protein
MNPYDPPPPMPGAPAEPAPSSGFFVERSIIGDQQQVVLRYLAIYHWLRWPTLVATIAVAFYSPSSQLCFVGVAILWVCFVAVGIPYWAVGREIKDRMRMQPVTIQGSRYSFANPMTYRWNLAPP